ncbi:nuclear transport factor 2 family protein [Spirulina sp. CS-785/01]|uniref:YybH family protein n=1 Tax=Spirulina sp. CS-785/01 TaxID=3021716 RepID=UPI002330B46B|nr:nuclear transport factor 2 family protein [Spirulina sp. CS-785/01]MDB9315878.1 nuclear transport factor 2 family protein [Spirulina sp. CS-785/01]
MKLYSLGLGLLLSLFLWGNYPQPAQAATSPELQSILKTREMALEAINTRDFSQIKPYLHPDFTITTVDNQVFTSVEDFERYWNDQFAGPIEQIAMELADETTRTFLTPEIEVAQGQVVATFSFTSGREETMAMRWTAVLQKLEDIWAIQSLHFSANLLDNPVLGTSRTLGRNIAIGVGVGGVIIGALVMFFLSPRISKKS